MKFSIITAVFNGARDIAGTLDSVAEQDHESIEHVIVDGASSDETLQIVRSHDARVARVISEPDVGVYDAFNKGLRLVTGDAIGFLNCGDRYSSSKALSKINAEFINPNVEAVFGDLEIVDPIDHRRIIRHYSSRYFAPNRTAYGLMPAHPTLFLRRSVYRQVGEYDPRFKIAGDFELCLRVFTRRSTNYRYLPEVLVNMPSGGLSNRGWRSIWDITREMKLACSVNGVDTSYLKLCMRLPLKILEMMWGRQAG